MKIYTKTGDQGETSLVDGSRVQKCHLRVDCYGLIDELNTYLGLAICKDPLQKFQFLQRIQENLFTLGSRVANPGTVVAKQGFEFQHECRFLEEKMDEYEGELAPLKNFILPGGCELAALFHLCRTHCRSSERRLVELNMQVHQYEGELIYLNRLSDLFFVLARQANFLEGQADILWQGTKK